MTEKRTILAEDGPKHKKLIVKMEEYKGNQLLDLRYYYFDNDKSEFLPTRKGVMLTRSNYLTVKKVIEKNHEQVMDWLGVGYLPDYIANRQQAQEEAYKSSQHLDHETVVATEDLARDPNFFNVEHLGGLNRVTINEAHPWIRRMLNYIESGDIGPKGVELIAEMLAAYSSAKMHLYESPSIHPEVLFEQLEYDWAGFLKGESR